MDFLNKTFAQISDVFRSMTPGARITSGLLLIAIVVSLVYLFRYQTGYGDIHLFGGRDFSQKELAAMEAAFSKAGLNEWTQERGRILIPRNQRYEYIAALADDNALPEDFDSIMEELINSDSPFETKQSREFKENYAQQKLLGMMISKMSGVEEAFVRIDVDKGSGLSAKKEIRAVAGVRGADNRPLPDEVIESVRQVVLKGNAGLKPESLTVIDLKSNRHHSGSSWNGLANANDNVYAASQRLFEREYREKVYDHLSMMIPGIIVGVDIALNPEVRHQENSIEYNQPTPIETSNLMRDETSSTPVQGGRPGVVPNAEVRGNQPAQLTSQEVAQSQLSEARDEQKNIAGHMEKVVENAPLVPLRTKASIAIPTSYFTKIWHERNSVEPGEQPKTPVAVELKNIEEETKKWVENAVLQLIPTPPAGVDPYPLVNVTTFTETTPPLPEEPTNSDLALSWLAGNWQSVAMILVGLLSLIFLRGMIRSGDRSPAEVSLPATPEGVDEEEEEDEEAKEEAINTLLQRRLKMSGGSLREELADIVRQDPDAAAHVLRNWIGDAA